MDEKSLNNETLADLNGDFVHTLPNPVQLDKWQLAAINSNAQFLQIIGYPGAGKTLVIAHYIARLIESGIDPSGVVALTYTKSARHTLRKTIINALIGSYYNSVSPSIVAEAVKINNFHGFSQDIITKYGEDVGFPADFHMYDALDSKNLIANPLSGLSSRTTSVNLHESSESERRKYRGFLKLLKTYDFDLALQLSAELIRSGKSTAISHVLVDEFQDCTNLQWELIKAIQQQNPHARIVVCGDPNQEIFGFQADHFENAFETMKKEFATTEERELLCNYRSTPEISSTVQSMLMNSGMKVHPASKPIQCLQPSGSEPELIACLTKEFECQAVLDKIHELCRDHRFRTRDIAILVRTNASVHKYMRLLHENDIPCQSIVSLQGLGLRKLPSVAITLMKWALHPRDLYLMQLLYNPLCRFIRRPAFDKLETLLNNDRDLNLQDALIKVNGRVYNHPFIAEWLPSLQTRLLAARSTDDIVQVLQDAIEQWEAQTCLKPKISSRDTEDWQDFLKHLRSLFDADDIAKLHEIDPSSEKDHTPGRALAAVLDRLYAPDQETLPGIDKVTIMTIHAAKSREWPAVLIPSSDIFTSKMDTPINSLRVQYVGASRAQNALTFFSTGNSYSDPPLKYLPISQLPRLPLTSTSEAFHRYPRVFGLRNLRKLSRKVPKIVC